MANLRTPKGPWLLILVVPAMLYGLHRIEGDSGSSPARVRAAGVLPAPFHHTAATPTTLQARFEVPDDEVPLGSGRRATETIGRGGTLAGAIDRLGVDSRERHRLVRDLSEPLDLRRLSPRTGLVASIDDAGHVTRLSVRAEAGRFVRLTPGTEGRAAHVEIVDLPTVDRVETAGGRIATSVHQALSSMPYSHELTMAYADIFQWDVDLLVDPRPGDEVRVVYEARYLGEVPDDLPEFGEAASRPGEFLGLGRILAASYEGRLARSSAYLVERPDGPDSYYDADGRPLRKTFLKSPLNYRRISSRFSRARRHPVTRRVVPHHGVDFAAAPGTPVVASADGKVVSAGWEGALGRAVRVRHGSEFVTVYGHLKGFAKGIRAGASVRQNQIVGYVGSSGRATGPHLHYTLIHRGQAIDPLRFRSPSVEPLDASLMPLLVAARGEWEPLLGTIPTDLADASAPSTNDTGQDASGI